MAAAVDPLLIAAILGGLAALVTIGGVLWAAFVALRRRLGRRQRKYAQLNKLSAGPLLSVFKSNLGLEPALAQDRTAEIQECDSQGKPTPVERTFRQHFFVDRDYYVQAVCDQAESVLAFSVTTRSKKFKPTFEFPPKPSWRARRKWEEQVGQHFRFLHQVTLGKTKFSDLESGSQQIKVVCGARSYSYTETFYYGNPGYYQHYAFTASSAVHQIGEVGQIFEMAQALGPEWVGGFIDNGAERLERSELLAGFRGDTTITTYTVLGAGLRVADYPFTFGPHGDEVRVLPE